MLAEVGNHFHSLPLCVLECLATTMALAAKEWWPPSVFVCRIFEGLSGTGVAERDFLGLVICVDAASDLGGYRVGGLVPGV